MRPAAALCAFLFIPLAARISAAADKKPDIPPGFDFIRSFDAEAFVLRQNKDHTGDQSARLRLRYLDPDVNAFVGMLTSFDHFNRDLRIGDPATPDTSGLLWNGGIDLGLVRGKHLWELDLMVGLLSSNVAFVPALSGEHRLSSRWMIYHRWAADFFAGDTLVDLDQGIIYQWNCVGLSAGYRVLTALHTNRSGPRVGIVFRFESPKIPFLLPSLG